MTTERDLFQQYVSSVVDTNITRYFNEYSVIADSALSSGAMPRDICIRNTDHDGKEIKYEVALMMAIGAGSAVPYLR